ncbi:F-box/kelch-repeat protein At3g23880-like [Silene latifolia]|uniref:F-box/kelch-repeat protein At3g23880-like n=1 Tax=Silene latifolia TaxID=37657 RepID=UPI003D779F80
MPRSSQFTYLPTEVWTQIFATLPTKSLLRFRCVCKSWCSIIDNPDFIGMHFKLCEINSGNNLLLLALEGVGNIRDEDWLLTLRESQTLQNISRIFWISDIYPYQIKSSYNGLLLVLQHGPHGSQLRLWNPCIRKSLLLPTCPLPNYLSGTRYLLGFAPGSKDYKVVAFAFENTRIFLRKIQFAIYTLRDQLWTVNTNTICMLDLHSLSTAVFFRGAAYWLGNNDKVRSGITHLGSSDYDKEIIAFFDLPISLDKGSLRFLFLLGGSLAIFSISLAMSNIWMLELDNEKGSWTLWFSGKSSPDGYEVFKSCYGYLEKVFYCETDGGYFVCRRKTCNIATCQVQDFKGSIIYVLLFTIGKVFGELGIVPRIWSPRFEIFPMSKRIQLCLSLTNGVGKNLRLLFNQPQLRLLLLFPLDVC